MNENLQKLEVKIENEGSTPQGRLSATEWNILVAAVKALDLSQGELDDDAIADLLKPYITTEEVAQTYATQSSLNTLSASLNDFLSGSDTDTIINKWSELETFLAGLAESDNLATILSGKADKATTLAGYGITDAYTKTHIDNTFVKLATAQTITARHNFADGLQIASMPIYKSQDDVIFIDANVVVRGGVTAWGTDGQTAASVFDALPIDGVTIKRDDSGVLYAVAQGTGGIDESQLADYLTTNNYATTSDISSALSGYATQSWVTGKGYLTGITGTMVSDALGYIPYNSENFTKANIKSTLGISDWALASAKPTYTYSEISGTPTSLKNPNALSWSGFSSGSYDGSTAQNIALPTKLSQLTDDVVAGKYLPLRGGTVNGALNMNAYFQLGNSKPITVADTDGVYQTALYLSTANNFIIGYGTSVVGKRKTVLLGNRIEFKSAGDESNTLVLNADHSSVFSGNIGIGTTSPETRLHVNGYAKITNDLYLGGVLRNANATWLLGEDSSNGAIAIGSAIFAQDRYLNNLNGKLRLTAEGGVEAQLTYLDSNPALGNLDAKGVLRLTPTNGFGLYSWVRNTGDGYIQVGSDSRYATPKSFNLIMQALGGNVGIGTASPTSKLHTASSSGWGVMFDGGSMSKIVGAHADGFGMLVMSTTPTTSDSYIFRVWQGSLTGASGSGTAVLDVRSNGVVNIGGNLLATGGITAQNSSDERLKRNIRKFNASKVLMSLGAVWEYEYIDSEVQKNHIYEGTHYGLIYQHVRGTTLDVMCHEREDGMGALNYLHPKFISLIAGATMENISEVEKLKRKIRHLEAKVKQLEQRA